MMVRGDLDSALATAFERIKNDIDDLNKRVQEIENNDGIDYSRIRSIVEETVKEAMKGVQQTKPTENRFITKINRNKKKLIVNRILSLSSGKDKLISEIRDILVYDEELCSRATFYRYLDKLIKRNKIQILEVDEAKIVCLIN